MSFESPTSPEYEYSVAPDAVSQSVPAPVTPRLRFLPSEACLDGSEAGPTAVQHSGSEACLDGSEACLDPAPKSVPKKARFLSPERASSADAEARPAPESNAGEGRWLTPTIHFQRASSSTALAHPAPEVASPAERAEACLALEKALLEAKKAWDESKSVRDVMLGDVPCFHAAETLYKTGEQVMKAVEQAKEAAGELGKTGAIILSEAKQLAGAGDCMLQEAARAHEALTNGMDHARAAEQSAEDMVHLLRCAIANVPPAKDKE